MSDLNNILVSVLLVLGCGLLVALIAVVFRAVRTLDLVNREIGNLNAALLPLLERFRALSERAESTLGMLEKHRETISESVEYIRRITRNVARLEELVFDEIEPVLREFASVLSGMRKGLRAFTENWRRPRA